MISFYEIQKQEDDGFEVFIDSYFKTFYDIINKSMHILQLEYPEINEVPLVMRQMCQDNFINSKIEFIPNIIKKKQNKSFINFQNNTLQNHTLSKKQIFSLNSINSDESILVNVNEEQLNLKKKKINNNISFSINKSSVKNESQNLYSNLLFYLPEKN